MQALPKKNQINDIAVDIINRPHILGHYIGYPDLSTVHDKWIKGCFDTTHDNSLQAHRKSYKSTAICIVGVLRYLFLNPNHRVLILRKSYTDAVDIVKVLKEHYESEVIRSLYYNLFGIKKIETGNWKNDSLTLSVKNTPSNEGSIDAAGIRTSLTGRHYDLIICDDIITEEDRYSPAEREQTDRVVRELVNIIEFDGHVIFTGTPWHKLDSWRLCPKPLQYPLGSIKIKGLTPEKIAEAHRKIASESLWSANYLLKHVASEDLLFAEPMRGSWPEELNPISVIDPAFHGKNKTAMAVGGLYKPRKRIPVRGYLWRKSIVDLYQEIISICDELHVYACYIESNADKGMSFRALNALRPGLFHEYYESENKFRRILTFIKPYWNLIDFADDIQPEFLHEVLEYNENEENDDAPDALAGLMRLLTAKARGPKMEYIQI